MQPSAKREIPRAQWAMPLDEVEAGEVHVLQIEVSGDMPVKEGELEDYFTDRTGHLAVQLPSSWCPARISYGTHMIWTPYHLLGWRNSKQVDKECPVRSVARTAYRYLGQIDDRTP